MSAVPKRPPTQDEVNLKVVDKDLTQAKSVKLIEHYVRAMVKHDASDLHIKADSPPFYRISGKLMLAKSEPIGSDKIKKMLSEIMNSRHFQVLDKNRQVDFSCVLNELGRYRINVYYQKGMLSCAIRTIPSKVPDLDSLGLPSFLKELALQKAGLILVTGRTGTGKSTTLAAMVDYINRHRHCHILTVEDPIEFMHTDQKSSISQREIGTDASTVQSAIVGSLRQDPDVILVGEVRDYEAIGAAVTAAETGHLVITTLHTHDAKSSIDRIIDVFPAESKDQIRVQISSSLTAVICQRLVKKKDGSGRMAVCEILVNSPTVQRLIRDNHLDKIDEAISTSKTYYKMQTFNQALEKLVQEDKVTMEDAIAASNSPEDLKMRLAGFKKEEGY